MKTQQWRKLNSSDITHTLTQTKKIELSAEFLEQEFQRVSSWEISSAEYFNEHPILDIDYEDLAKATHVEFRKLTEFLGVEYYDPFTDLEKQNPEPLSDLISNYAQLKKYFEDTKWADYFT